MRLSVAADAEPAAWLVSHMRTFAESVLSLVPSGFAAYVRIFHPAERREDGATREVRWAEVAASLGTRTHPGMQLESVSGKDMRDPLPGVYDSPPSWGSLPEQAARLLAQTLRSETSTAQRCWFAVWDGYEAAQGSVIATAPRFRLPGRDYHLLIGPVDALAESVLDPPSWQTANLCWPDDHAWCLASEIDLNSTYIACTESCRDAILALPEVEALEIDPTTGISSASHTLSG